MSAAAISRTARNDPRWPAIGEALASLRDAKRRAVRIVDADCGAGAILIQALRHARALGFTAIEGRGIDSSPALIGRARAAAARLHDPAIGVAFDVAELSAPANTPFKIDFDNQDASVPHNVAIHEGSPTGTEVFKGAIFPGVAKQTYDVPALPAGAYAFVCTVHPNMTGTLTVN